MEAFECGDVGEVLRSAGGALVLEQFVQPDDIAAKVIGKVCLYLPWPSVFEANTAYRCKNVNASWLDPDLQTHSGAPQISLRQSHQRSAELH